MLPETRRCRASTGPKVGLSCGRLTYNVSRDKKTQPWRKTAFLESTPERSDSAGHVSDSQASAGPISVVCARLEL